MSDIKINRHHGIRDVTNNATPKRSSSASQTQDTQSTFDGSVKLDGQLSATPDVRADAVERAKKLIADPNYPDATTIESVAKSLANEIKS